MSFSYLRTHFLFSHSEELFPWCIKPYMLQSFPREPPTFQPLHGGSTHPLLGNQNMQHINKEWSKIQAHIHLKYYKRFVLARAEWLDD